MLQINAKMLQKNGFVTDKSVDFGKNFLLLQIIGSILLLSVTLSVTVKLFKINGL